MKQLHIFSLLVVLNEMALCPVVSICICLSARRFGRVCVPGSVPDRDESEDVWARAQGIFPFLI